MSLELILLLAPAVLLFAALLLGRYPGERAIERARRTAQAVRLRAPSATGVRVRPAVLVPRGGRLVGAAIAARPPPACG